MDQFGFPFSTPHADHQSLAPPVGRVIHSSTSELEIRYPDQLGLHSHGAIATPMDPAHAFRQPTWSQHLEQTPVSFLSDDSQTSLSHHETSNTLMAAILSRPDIAAFRDTVCSYLRLTSGLWAELYKPREYSTAHHLLTRCLSQKYGRLPPDLWRLINELRDHHDFEHSRYDYIDIISSIPTPKNQFPNHLAPSAYEGRAFSGSCSWSVPRPPEESSPLVGQISSPVPGPVGQTRCTTPVFTANGRRRFQTSSNPRKKGRAPKGERYKCPYTNCRHDAFRNAGNFSNHMRNCHAESEYRNQHPADFLVPDSSPQLSNQGDTTSSAVTNASDSPLTRRRLSEESGTNEDGAATADDEDVRDIGDIIFPAEQDEFQTSMSQGMFSQGAPGAPVTGGIACGSLLEAFRFVPANYQAQHHAMSQGLNDMPRSSPREDIEFSQLQIMNEQEWDTRRRG
ncbi:uncharacterized protein Z519_08019 [Cladophialophora bantiana CBS 173.52]|uniref:Uncharacterized protein n=1 Tax=Cladophialophora bantiana (strain ATCC 10958 / CBS 173.52 / CDC B-1940 / NIH 8579) TaxID=1442370 RepID=A0A0D2HK56_CLAB1|nr:uncharacterized protein Z519_08019 [Cladophialophora bantiana CBS 173.52]KIW91125.1 hypothetical protein Z519_08019 [Cladophialophora bantiana CBS 173.52]